jgi:homoserine dehydrogenase
MYYGRGAGAQPTASAVTADLIDTALGLTQTSFSRLGFWPDMTEPVRLLPSDKTVGRFYVRVLAEDKPGVIARIASCLADHQISITSLQQNEDWMEDGVIPVAITTHEAVRGEMEKAVQALNASKEIRGETVLIEILDEHQESIA